MNAAKKISFDRAWFKADSTELKSKRAARFEQIEVIKSEDLPELLTAKEAATILRRHIKTIELYRDEGKLRFRKIGGRYYTTPEYIAQFLESEEKKNA